MLDPMPTWLLKDPNVCQTVLPILTAAINTSLNSAVVPPCLKTAIISPLLKKTGLDPDDLKNYRPISNLPFIGKVLEKIVAHQIVKHLDTHRLYDPFQSAYRGGHSIETVLLKIKSDVNAALDQGQGTILVQLDLSAAFDTIDHAILLDRLENYCGITGDAREWVRSYLEDRTQTVVIGDTRSDPASLD
jgi:hypothetical protein